MDYPEFIARVTFHIPDKGQVMVRYYGLYANAHRGKVRKANRVPVVLVVIGLASLGGLLDCCERHSGLAPSGPSKLPVLDSYPASVYSHVSLGKTGSRAWRFLISDIQ